MKVTIILGDGRFSLDRRMLSSLAGRVLEGEAAADGSINIVYCSDRHMQSINRRFGNNDKVTDVLAFDLSDGEKTSDLMGEVYVNLQQARRQAGGLNIPYMEEVKRLTVHGILHLLGYRDRRPVDRRKMWARQEGYL
jgi:probable rRNA maturation factor